MRINYRAFSALACATTLVGWGMPASALTEVVSNDQLELSLGGMLSGEAELNYGSFANSFGAVNALGGRLPAAYDCLPFEVALRYAMLVPDTHFAITNTTAGSATLGQTTAVMPDGSPIHELTPAISYFVDGDRLKFTLDFPITFNDPIVTEAGVGSYNLVNQPDQTCLLTSATNTLSRQLVFQVRGGLQYAF